MREHPENPIFGPEDPRLDPPNPPEIQPARSIVKAISWRVVGTLDTLILSFVIPVSYTHLTLPPSDLV